MSKEQKLAQVYQLYLPAYRQLVERKLGQFTTIKDVLPAFPRQFAAQPQAVPQNLDWVTHPRSMEHGVFLCDTAIIILAYWWELIHQVEVFTAREDCLRHEFDPHWAIGLSRTPQLSPDELSESYYAQRKLTQAAVIDTESQLPIIWLHWLHEGGLQPTGITPQGRMTGVTKVIFGKTTPDAFAKKRISARGLPPTKKIIKSFAETAVAASH